MSFVGQWFRSSSGSPHMYGWLKPSSCRFGSARMRQALQARALWRLVQVSPLALGPGYHADKAHLPTSLNREPSFQAYQITSEKQLQISRDWRTAFVDKYSLLFSLLLPCLFSFFQTHTIWVVGILICRCVLADLFSRLFGFFSF